MINIAICDDNVPFTEYIDRLIVELSSRTLEKISTTIFYSGESFLKKIEGSCDFDIILMDIEMEGIDGIDVGKILRLEDDNDNIFLIYISSHDSYWRQLFDVQPYAFLEKPIDEKIFYEKIMRLIKKIIMIRSKGIRKVLPIQVNGQEYIIPTKKIIYLESKIRKITLFTTDETIEYYSTLNKEEEKLDPKEFIRIHQSYIIHLPYAKKISNEFVALTNNKEIPVSNSHRSSIKKAYLEYRRNYLE